MGQPSHCLVVRYVVGNRNNSCVNSNVLTSVEPNGQRLYEPTRTLLSSRKLTHLIENIRNGGTSPFTISLLLMIVICVVILFNVLTRKRRCRGTIPAAEATNDVDIELYDRGSQPSQV